MAGGFLTTGPPGKSWPACLWVWSFLNSSDHHHDQEQATSITLKISRCCHFLVSPSTPEFLTKGSVCLHYILSFAILNVLIYSEYKTFLIPVIHKHLSPNNLIASLFITGDMSDEIYFPPHPQSSMLCTQQAPMRFFRSENEFCCLSSCLSGSPQSYISHLWFPTWMGNKIELSKDRWCIFRCVFPHTSISIINQEMTSSLFSV